MAWMPSVSWTFRSLDGVVVPAAHPPSPNRAAVPVHIETNGYLLRSVVAQDITPRVVHWINSESMRSGLNLSPLNFDLERLRCFVTSFDSLHNHFIGIIDKTNGLLVGFYTLDVNLMHKVGNVTCGIGEADYQGRRVLWQTIDALLDHFFLYRDVEKITARILARNRPMLFNFIDNTRFVFEAKLLRECIGTAGERMDVLVFAAHRNGSREAGTAP
jgi:RimJ/RimL family protein N-acetyltransferase